MRQELREPPACCRGSPTSWAFTTAPRIATASTPPNSRLVLSVDAAIPERSGGTIANTAAVTATSASPSPKPTQASATASCTDEMSGLKSVSTHTIAAPAIRQPAVIGPRGPRAAVQIPATRPATTMATDIAANSSAIFQPEKCATI